MVIVEPRRLPEFPQVVQNFTDMLPNVPLTVCCSAANREYVLSVTDASARILAILPDAFDVQGYNELLLSEAFWELFESPKILVFQCDTGIRKNSILEFMHVGYVGAPWAVDWGVPGRSARVGNGGLSLRDRQAMLDALRRVPGDRHLPEDIFFARHAEGVASVALAKRFSMEAVAVADPLGFHKPWAYFPENHLRDLMDSRLWDQSNGKELVTVVCHEDPDVAAWLRIGVGPAGLRVPAGSVVPAKDLNRIIITVDGNAHALEVDSDGKITKNYFFCTRF